MENCSTPSGGVCADAAAAPDAAALATMTGVAMPDCPASVTGGVLVRGSVEDYSALPSSPVGPPTAVA
jgi:hypothetical protein